MSFVAITCIEGSRACYVSCSRDNLRFFPAANPDKNMNKLRIDFRDVHDTLVDAGFKLATVGGTPGHMTHHYEKKK